MISYSIFEHNAGEFHYKIIEPLSADYKVFVCGREIPVYTCRISKHPFNRFFPGYQRSIDQTELASFINIVSDEEVEVEIEINRSYEKIMVRPVSYGISAEKNGNRFSLSLKPGQQVVFAADDFHNCLFLFNSKPITAPKKEDVTYYFGPGIHVAGKITLKDNESIYVDKDALVFGSVYAENAKNLTISGNGIFDDSCEARFTRGGYENYVNGNIKFFDCQNVKIEGVLFRDSAIWSVNIFHCKNVEIDSIKIFGQWRYNTDGVDIVNSREITLKNSFIHSFDDSIVIKGIDRYFNTDNENILIHNCILWCDWGKTCEIGIETSCRRYKNIKFSHCNILRAGNTALDIQNGDFAEISDVIYENINIELNAFDEMPVFQNGDDMVYNPGEEQMIALAISIKNHRYRRDLWGKQYTIPDSFDLSGIEVASVHDITFRNITVYYDKNISEKRSCEDLVEIESTVDSAKFYNIEIENFKIKS